MLFQWYQVIIPTSTRSLSISVDRNAPYIAVGVKSHSKCEVLIYNYEKNVDQLPNPKISLGKLCIQDP